MAPSANVVTNTISTNSSSSSNVLRANLICGGDCLKNAAFYLEISAYLVFGGMIALVIGLIVDLIVLIVILLFELKPHIMIAITLDRLIQLRTKPQQIMPQSRVYSGIKIKPELNDEKFKTILKDGFLGVRYTNPYLYPKPIRELYEDFSSSLNDFFKCLHYSTNAEFRIEAETMQKIAKTIKNSNYRSLLTELYELKKTHDNMPEYLKTLRVDVWHPFDFIKFLISPTGITLTLTLIGTVATILSGLHPPFSISSLFSS